MVQEDRHKINCWIPGNLWEKVEALGHDSPTKATIAAFETLTTKEALGNSQEALGKAWEEKIQELEKQLQEALAKIKELEDKLSLAPDPVEFAQLQTKTEEQEKYNNSLKNELEKSERDKEDLKNMYNNYFLQVQSLINQKAIEAQGNKKSILSKLKFW